MQGFTLCNVWTTLISAIYAMCCTILMIVFEVLFYEKLSTGNVLHAYAMNLAVKRMNPGCVNNTRYCSVHVTR